MLSFSVARSSPYGAAKFIGPTSQEELSLFDEKSLIALFKLVGIDGKKFELSKEQLTSLKTTAGSVRSTFYRRIKQWKDIPGVSNTVCGFGEYGSVCFYPKISTIGNSVARLLLTANGYSDEQIEEIADEHIATALIGSSPASEEPEDIFAGIFGKTGEQK